MPNTFELIASSTVGSGGAANISFSSIASSWTDLCLVMSLKSNRSAGGTDVAMLTVNSNTSNGSWRELYGNASLGVGSQSGSSEMRLGYCGTSTGSDTNIFGSLSAYFPNYAGSTNKSFSTDNVTERNTSDAYAALIAGLWSNTAAITSLSIAPLLGTLWAQYSTAYLYGVKNA